MTENPKHSLSMLVAPVCTPHERQMIFFQTWWPPLWVQMYITAHLSSLSHKINQTAFPYEVSNCYSEIGKIVLHNCTFMINEDHFANKSITFPQLKEATANGTKSVLQCPSKMSKFVVHIDCYSVDELEYYCATFSDRYQSTWPHKQNCLCIILENH